MKFVIRRLIVGVVSIPFVAGAYTFIYLSLIALGANPSASLSEVFANGVNIAIVIALILGFYPQFSRFANKLLNV